MLLDVIEIYLQLLCDPFLLPSGRSANPHALLCQEGLCSGQVAKVFTFSALLLMRLMNQIEEHLPRNPWWP